jgi:hypothetical protein
MSDETTPQGDSAMSPASAGSVASDIVGRLVAWRDERGFPTPGEMMDEAAAEIARLRLTDAERELLDTLRRSEYLLPHGVKIIDGLLERLGNS